MRVGLAADDDTIRINRSLKHVEGIIQSYGLLHNIPNPYVWFSDQLGYKARNYLYKLLADQEAGDIKIRDIKTIIKITGDTSLADVVFQELVNG